MSSSDQLSSSLSNLNKQEAVKTVTRKTCLSASASEVAREHSVSLGQVARILSSLESKKEQQKVPDGTANSSNKKNKHLFLHFDINETILVGDEAGGDTVADCLHKMLAKSALVQIPKEFQHNTNDKDPVYEDTLGIQPTHWWNGDPLSFADGVSCSSNSNSNSSENQVPPLFTGWKWPAHCDSFYRCQKKRGKDFCSTNNAGSIYQPTMKALQNALPDLPPPIKKNHKNDNDNATNDHGILAHLIPAFWETLIYLSKQREREQQQQQSPDKKCTIVFRTFGSDLPDVAHAVAQFAQGNHPLYPDFQDQQFELKEESQLFCGKWKETVGDEGSQPKFVYQLWNYNQEKLIASGDAAVLDVLHSQTICGIRDDYPFWKQQGKLPWAGKPIWKLPSHKDDGDKNRVDSDNDEYRCRHHHHHHVLFDDNIHNLQTYSIASVRAPKEESRSIAPKEESSSINQQQEHGELLFDFLTANQIRKQHGVHLIRVPTIEPILNKKWFIQQIQNLEEQELV